MYPFKIFRNNHGTHVSYPELPDALEIVGAVVDVVVEVKEVEVMGEVGALVVVGVVVFAVVVVKVVVVLEVVGALEIFGVVVVAVVFVEEVGV